MIAVMSTSTVARMKITAMMDMGFEIAAIADGAGLSKSTVHDILSGKPGVRRRSLEKILALDPNVAVEGHRVPNCIVTKMLDELRSNRLTLQWIYRTAGVNPKLGVNFSGQRVSWDTYVRLKRVYDAFFESSLIAKEARDGATA
jgi:hypothetical protein